MDKILYIPLPNFIFILMVSYSLAANYRHDTDLKIIEIIAHGITCYSLTTFRIRISFQIWLKNVKRMKYIP